MQRSNPYSHTMISGILYQTIQLLKATNPEMLNNLLISEVCIGSNLSAVRLSDQSLGFASTLYNNEPHCKKQNRDFSDFTPLQIEGKRVIDLFETEKNTNLTATLRVAVLNAISSQLLAGSPYKILENTDPIDLLDLSLSKNITLVGGFQSYIQKIASTNNHLKVLELNPAALAEADKRFYVPASEFQNILPLSDIVIITGLTLVNNTIDGLLTAITPGTQVIVTGPSSSIIPDILFKNKVSIIGSTRITKPERLFPLVRQGGTGYHLFTYCAQKICILNDN